MTEYNPTIGFAFAADTSGHQLTILLDQGDHKHLRAHTVDQATGNPRHLYSVDLVTWPGRVAVSGDMDGFTFRADLPTLRTATQNGDISWSYLAEKVAAGRENVRGFSEEAFHREIRDQVDQATVDGTAPEGLAVEVHDRFLDDDYAETFHTEEAARWVARDFEYSDFIFGGVDEWDLTAYTSDFERAALGVQLVIRLYDRELAARATRQADPKILGQEAYDRQRLVDEYRGAWVIDPAVENIPRNLCPVCATPTEGRDEWAAHMADHGGPALSWMARWYEIHPEAA